MADIQPWLEGAEPIHFGIFVFLEVELGIGTKTSFGSEHREPGLKIVNV